MTRLLIVEDEEIMRTGLRDTLMDAGFTVETAADGEAGLKQALESAPDLILLDIMLPRLDGLAVCRELRRQGRWCPVLMLTARGLVDDRVDGLDAGADDYLVKPFSGAELLARVRALLRGRAHAGNFSSASGGQEQSGAPASRNDLLSLGDITVDFTRMECRRHDGGTLEMTAREFAVLRLLVQRRGKPVTRDQFLDLVWGLSAGITTRTVDNHIAMLRSKIEANPSRPRWIRTVHKVGYRLEW
ncbi:MAG: response regulator transcription factor [Verrucomicrobiaceae bacterium]|nr:MAG: response regulator transcription factor [Verrucomicrobiaceae bacterium]